MMFLGGRAAGNTSAYTASVSGTLNPRLLEGLVGIEPSRMMLWSGAAAERLAQPSVSGHSSAPKPELDRTNAAALHDLLRSPGWFMPGIPGFAAFHSRPGELQPKPTQGCSS